MAASLGAGALFVLRTWRVRQPIVDLRALADRDFALGCVLSFILGVGLYGSIYLMPVFSSRSCAIIPPLKSARL